MVFFKDPSLLLFILYIFHLSTVIFNSAANHHFYADTQLFLWFLALDLSYNISHLDNTTANVSDWLFSNFLSLNPSKTELLMFGLPQKPSKLNNLTIHYLTILYSCLLIQPAILVLFIITLCHLHNVSLLFLNHAFTIFMI